MFMSMLVLVLMLCIIIDYFLVIIQAIFPTSHYFYLDFAFILITRFIITGVIYVIANSFIGIFIFAHVT